MSAEGGIGSEGVLDGVTGGGQDTNGDMEWEKELLDTFNEIAPIANSLGLHLSFDADKTARISFAYNPELNSAARSPRQTGAVHGGMYGIVADTAGEAGGGEGLGEVIGGKGVDRQRNERSRGVNKTANICACYEQGNPSTYEP